METKCFLVFGIDRLPGWGHCADNKDVRRGRYKEDSQ